MPRPHHASQMALPEIEAPPFVVEFAREHGVAVERQRDDAPTEDEAGEHLSARARIDGRSLQIGAYFRSAGQAAD